jgi:hypothetical protein
MNHSRFPIRPVGLLTFAVLAYFPLVKTTAAPVPAIPKAAPLKAEPFPLESVRLLDGPFRDAMLRDKAYLLILDPDRLLHNFRVTAGLLPPPSHWAVGRSPTANCAGTRLAIISRRWR